MMLQAIQIAFRPFVSRLHSFVMDLTVTIKMYCSDCHPALHVHFGTQHEQPLFRLIHSVTLEGEGRKTWR